MTGLLVALTMIASPVPLSAQGGQSVDTSVKAHTSEWQYGAFADVGYLGDLNSPSNHLFRSRGTTPRVDQIVVDMAGAYLRKKPAETSRWGLELTGHGGEDSQLFGFSATAPNIDGAGWLRHLGPTNVSYLLPVGSGLTVQGGIFSSFIGYDGLYAKDNFTYTRPWTADFTPYLMLGVNAGYSVTDKVTVTGFVLNGYWHLAHANDVPSIGGQVAYQASNRVTVKETVLYGPHQANTSLDLWRFFSNTILELKTDRLTSALDFHVGTERVDTVGTPRAWWVAGQVLVHWAIHAPWSVTLRPEFAWDSEGRWTTFRQTVYAFTSTLEYRARLGQSQAVVRLEHRYDRSTGPAGGFFKDIQPGVVGLTPGQHLLTVGVLLTLDGSFHR
jgi:putative OmpL-like beta-barrel porin-2